MAARKTAITRTTEKKKHVIVYGFFFRVIYVGLRIFGSNEETSDKDGVVNLCANESRLWNRGLIFGRISLKIRNPNTKKTRNFHRKICYEHGHRVNNKLKTLCARYIL